MTRFEVFSVLFSGGKSEPIETVNAPGGGGHCAKISVPESDVPDFLKVISKMGGVKVSEEYK